MSLIFAFFLDPIPTSALLGNIESDAEDAAEVSTFHYSGLHYTLLYYTNANISFVAIHNITGV